MSVFPHPENFTESENEEYSDAIQKSESIRLRAYAISAGRDDIAEMKEQIRELEERIAEYRKDERRMFKAMDDFMVVLDNGGIPEDEDHALEDYRENA